MDLTVRELDSIDWEALKNTCPEEDSGAASAELIRFKTLRWKFAPKFALCTPQRNRSSPFPPIRSIEAEEF